MDAGGPAARDGDRALAAMLRVHGMVCNGGFDHMLDVLSPAEVAAGADGFRYFGLDNVAALVTKASGADEAELDDLDAHYAELIPMDSVLVHRFEAVFSSARAGFAPVDGAG